jgi:hypothetical protein
MKLLEYRIYMRLTKYLGHNLLFILGLGSISTAANAQLFESDLYQPFQQFDRQYNLGFGVTSGTLTSGTNGGVYNTQFMNLEIERLFSRGWWFDVNATLLTYYSQNSDPATPLTGTTTGSQPSFGGISGKLGYAFVLKPEYLLLTPYAYLGRNTNFSSYTLSYAGSQTNLTQDYFISYGVGARLEYRVTDWLELYVDQNAVYNDSQAPVQQGLNSNDNYLYTSTLGSKFNVYRNLQLGAQAFYNNYYFLHSLNTISGQALVPRNVVGGVVSIGLTY